MIERDEIDQKSTEFEINTSNVQRDYVFGWLLFAIYQNEYLSDLLILKGGNCFRKAYFPSTRFSSDLDFSTERAVDLEELSAQIDRSCKMAQAVSGIKFVSERSAFKEAARANLGKNTDRKIYKGKVFFEDFYGQKSALEISVRMDVTEFDRLYLPVSTVPLIHPYSDSDVCRVNLRCVALEEGMASKLKCLLQRRHSHDLYDLVYAAFFDDRIDLDRSAIASVFLKKTIFERSPGSARQILLGLPMAFFRAAWEKYIVCPAASKIDFDSATEAYTRFVDSVFETSGMADRISDAFFPAELRNVFLEAGSQQRLIRLTYDGYDRIVEPYALSYKRPTDGSPREYFYVWDRTGGASGSTGIKSLVNPKVENPQILEEKFEPRFEVELSKAGELPENSYFGGGGRPAAQGKRGGSSAGRTKRRPSTYSGGPVQVIACAYCGKEFKRKGSGTALKAHKDKRGYDCYGRSGYFVRWEY
jgi:predicted nucleotidyltransferase component of viral defense system